MLKVRNITKSFGSLKVIDDLSLNIKKGERRVILGPNGAGKTSLFNLLSGELKHDSGDILLEDQSIASLSVDARARRGIGRSYQKNNLFNGLTIADNLSLACANRLGLSASLIKDANGNRRLQEAISQIAAQIGLEDQLEDHVYEISYGNRRQLEIGLALAIEPKVLLMDEPTSGIGPSGIEQFSKLIKSLPRDLTLLIIEHDMDLAFSIADSITVLNSGQVIFEGNPDQVRTNKLVQETYLGVWS